jgi:hypothetical protein
MISVLNGVERLFSGFEELMQSKIVKEDRSEIFNVSHYMVFTFCLPECKRI